MWISEPTPVISSTNRIDSGSISRLKFTVISPTENHSNSRIVSDRSSLPRPCIWMNSTTPKAKEISGASVPSR